MFGKFSVVLSCLAFGCTSYAADVENSWLVRVSNGTFDIRYSVRGRVENGVIAEYLRYEPLPQDNVYQKIIWTKQPPSKLIAVVPQTPDRYLRLDGRNIEQVPSLSYSFQVTFFKVRVDFSKIGKIYPYDVRRSEYKYYTRTIEETGEDASGKKRAWKDLQIPWIRQTSGEIMHAANGDVLAYVRRIYELVSEEFEYYDENAKGVHPKNLLQSIETKRGHCGLRHRVFVTLLRAAGVPARTKNCNRPSGSPHVWAEFYLERYGWVPVNLARKAGDFSHFGFYNDHCIIWNNDSCQDIKSPSGKNCRVTQSRGQWYWKTSTKKGKPIYNWEILGNESIK